MSQHPIMAKLAAKMQRKDLPEIKSGDTVRVQVKIKEGDKERIQAFERHRHLTAQRPTGQLHRPQSQFWPGRGAHLPFNSKVLDKVEIVRSNQVRRAKLFYLRELKGKAARLREGGPPTGRGCCSNSNKRTELSADFPHCGCTGRWRSGPLAICEL